MTLIGTSGQELQGAIGATDVLVRPKRPVRGAMFVNAIVPPAVFLALNGLAVLGGFEMPAGKIAAAFGVEGWIAAGAWLLALTNWGLVRGAMTRAGSRGRRAADWLLLLSAAGIAFPFITLGFDLFWTTFTAFLLGLLAVGTLSRVAAAMPSAAFAMAPSVIALVLPGLVGFSLMSMGWSPPFGVTQGADSPAP